MKLTNFELSEPYGAIELKALGRNWDLHNFADFKGFFFDPFKGNVVFEWRLNRTILKDQNGENGWGDPENHADGCRLIFENVTFLTTKKGNPEYPAEEGDCVSNISKKVPGEEELPFRDPWPEGEPFHLLFDFQNESCIEICAETVTFKSIPDAVGEEQ